MTEPINHKQTIPVKPKVKQRPRLGRRGRVFTPEQTLVFERYIGSSWHGPCADTPVSMVIGFYKDKVTITVKTLDGPASKLRGDIDNYAKSILDGLNGIAYTDDKLVQRLLVTKHE